MSSRVYQRVSTETLLTALRFPLMTPCVPNHFQLEESRAVGQTLPASTKVPEHVGVLLGTLYGIRGGYALRRSWPTPQDTDTYGVLQSYFKRYFRIGLETKHRL